MQPLIHNIGIYGKGGLTGRGLHGYSLVFVSFLLTGQSNIVVSFFLLVYIKSAEQDVTIDTEGRGDKKYISHNRICNLTSDSWLSLHTNIIAYQMTALTKRSLLPELQELCFHKVWRA